MNKNKTNGKMKILAKKLLSPVIATFWLYCFFLVIDLSIQEWINSLSEKEKARLLDDNEDIDY